MKTMIEKQQIILGYFRQGKSKKQLARELGISPHTVRRHIDKYLAHRGAQSRQKDSVVPPSGIVEPPTYDSSSRKHYKLTQPIKEHIDGILDQNAIKRDQGRVKATDVGHRHSSILIETGVSNKS